ncbi:MAG TPA: methyltransferase domain-containing protein [Pyrinomonadaceae bacterium]|nr:methyltransferase domain-containing protein [Pyrinomonadaceae bacterium]
MSESRSDKELAYLHDLYVATDWGERFAELIDEHLKLPKEGRALYVAAGTGGHALKLTERAGADVTLIGVDEHAERVEIARAKAAAAKLEDQADFRTTQLEALAFEDGQFELVVADASMVAPERLPEVLAEMVRVAAYGATVAFNLPTASSYGEFFSIYWEALGNAGLADESSVVEELINRLPTVSDAKLLAAREGLEDVRSFTNIEEFGFASAEEFLSAPLVRHFLLKDWLDPLADPATHGRVLSSISELIDGERHESSFALSVKATLVIGQKMR